MDEREERGKVERGELYLRLKGMGVFSLREYARAEGVFAPTERKQRGADRAHSERNAGALSSAEKLFFRGERGFKVPEMRKGKNGILLYVNCARIPRRIRRGIF